MSQFPNANLAFAAGILKGAGYQVSLNQNSNTQMVKENTVYKTNTVFLQWTENGLLQPENLYRPLDLYFLEVNGNLLVFQNENASNSGASMDLRPEDDANNMFLSEKDELPNQEGNPFPKKYCIPFLSKVNNGLSYAFVNRNKNEIWDHVYITPDAQMVIGIALRDNFYGLVNKTNIQCALDPRLPSSMIPVTPEIPADEVSSTEVTLLVYDRLKNFRLFPGLFRKGSHGLVIDAKDTSQQILIQNNTLQGLSIPLDPTKTPYCRKMPVKIATKNAQFEIQSISRNVLKKIATDLSDSYQKFRFQNDGTQNICFVPPVTEPVVAPVVVPVTEPVVSPVVVPVTEPVVAPEVSANVPLELPKEASFHEDVLPKYINDIKNLVNQIFLKQKI